TPAPPPAGREYRRKRGAGSRRCGLGNSASTSGLSINRPQQRLGGCFIPPKRGMTNQAAPDKSDVEPSSPLRADDLDGLHPRFFAKQRSRCRGNHSRAIPLSREAKNRPGSPWSLAGSKQRSRSEPRISLGRGAVVLRENKLDGTPLSGAEASQA